MRAKMADGSFSLRARQRARSFYLRSWGVMVLRGYPIPVRTQRLTRGFQVLLCGALVSLAIVGSASTVRAQAQSATATASAPMPTVGAQGSPQLFATMCALYAAGFEADEAVDPSNQALTQVRAQLLALNGPATQSLRKYYHEHELADPTQTMSRYVTFALVSGPAPKFEVSLQQQDLPPDVLALDGFSKVLANFYQEARIDGIWKQVQPVYDRAADLYRPALAEVAQRETGYLRELLRPGHRTFTVYIEPLVGSRTNVRNIGDQYAVVVNPQGDSLDLVRHAFLHFLLDPLPIRYADVVAAEAPLLRQAERAPQLPAEFHDDVSGFFTECLVRAVDLRLQHLPPQKLADQLNIADARGYVLVRPLMAALSKFDSAAPSMTLYFPDLVRSIDVSVEAKRLETVAFPPASDQQAVGVDVFGADVSPNARATLYSNLIAGERAIAAKDAPGAQLAFEHVLSQMPGQPRALYGLAVAFVLQGNGPKARDLFEQVVSAASGKQESLRPDAISLSWSYIYLGRMDDLAGNRDQALMEYHAALAVADAPEAARVAAQKGLDQAYQPAGRDASPGAQSHDSNG